MSKIPAEAEPWLEPQAVAEFDEAERSALYRAIALRRDVRHFCSERELDAAALERVLEAAHRAPSVGLSQPWGFVLVRDRAVRARIHASFQRCREREAARFAPERRAQYLALRLQGILEAPLNICVAVDLRPRAEPTLGTTVQPETLRASAYCAVQNLWLAARVEGIGVGWVSIVEPEVLRAELRLPPGVEPLAYLCIGYPRAFRRSPMLHEAGWRTVAPLSAALHPTGVWIDPDACEREA